MPQLLHGGPLRFGPYSLEARLAVGTTTEVYLAKRVDEAAEHLRPLPEQFVVKRLLPHLVTDPEGRARFEREASLHMAVSDANVVTAFGAGTTAHGEPYLAMEYVDGCDCFRLLRRTNHERTVLPVAASVFVTREVLHGLSAVHTAHDAEGRPLGIVHRDVTPSNIYLSREGDVKLGDFGIARSLARAPELSALGGEAAVSDASLMGKFSYLAPEQVAGEPFDHRADLFSTATVLAELLIGKPLFPGTGQLQVLLAIRDCDLSPLREAAPRLPAKLLAVVDKALSRDPRDRFEDAAAFAEALLPFQADAAVARKALGMRVVAVQKRSSDAHLAAVRESVRSMKAVVPPAATTARLPEALSGESGEIAAALDAAFDEPDDPAVSETGHYPEMLSTIETASGERIGPWPFVRLLDAIASGTFGRGDKVDYLGNGFRRIEDIPDLAKALPKEPPPPPPAASTARASYRANLAKTTVLDVLAHVLGGRQTGLLVAERPAAPGGAGPRRRELYFVGGRLHHVPAVDAGETVGALLFHRGLLSREELDMALAVLPRYGGRMGDTLLGLGLVDGIDMVRTLREQGHRSVTELFSWRAGTAEFYRDAGMPTVEFALDLDVPTLMLAGVEAESPGDAPMARLEPHLDAVVSPHAQSDLAGFAFPPVVTAVRSALARPMTIRELLGLVARSGKATGPEVARALEVLLALGLVRRE